MAAGPTSNTWTMITSPRMFLAALLGSIMIILGLMIALSSSEVERHLTALRRSRPASVVLRSDESSTPLALVSMSSDESTRYERVRERFVASIEGIGGIDLRKEDVRTIVDQVMATVGSLLDSPGVLLPTDASQGGGSSTSPSEQSKHKNKKKKNPPPKEKEEQQQKKGPPNQNAKSTPIKYVYENHFPDRAYVNETFDFIPADVGTARLVANCSTVFERVKKRFAQRFGDAATARASLARPESPPLYPQPAGGDGGLLYLRHVHKTGGSSMRHIFHDFSDWTGTASNG